MKHITQQLIEVREMRNLNIDQLALKTGIPKETLLCIESGELDPPVSTLIRICSELNCTISIGNISI